MIHTEAQSLLHRLLLRYSFQLPIHVTRFVRYRIIDLFDLELCNISAPRVMSGYQNIVSTC